MEPLNIKEESLKSIMDYEEPMDTTETPLEDYYEEGELNSSDDEKYVSENIKTAVPSIFTRTSTRNPSQGFVTGFDTFEKDEALKKLDRAKRFSLPVKPTSEEDVIKEQLLNLYRDLGIDKENERHYRFNAIHMRGTENMSTENVLQYFAPYAPSHVEWINDVSCNIVWMDDVSTARALLNMSKRIKNLDKVHLNADPFEKEFKEPEPDGDEMNDEDSVDARQIKAAIPPGFWRIGNPSKNSSFILLRYATRSDKKQRHAEKISEYYKKYGNPNFGNIPGIVSKSLRSELKKSKYKVQNSDRISDNNHENNKVLLTSKNNPWEELAYEWGKSDVVEESDYVRTRIPPRIESVSLRADVPDLRISLQNRKESSKRARVRYSESPNSSDKEIWETRSKVPRMKMYADDEQKKLEKSSGKRSHGSGYSKKPVEDLRSKINRKKNKARFKFMSEKRKPAENSDSESSNNENDDADSGDWALEHYHDLRESLEQSKRHEHERYRITKYQTESDYEDEDEEEEDDIYTNLGHRSPLQIEIDNDEYYQKKKMSENC